jgi:hypothetical protein
VRTMRRRQQAMGTVSEMNPISLEDVQCCGRRLPVKRSCNVTMTVLGSVPQTRDGTPISLSYPSDLISPRPGFFSREEPEWSA